MSRHNKKNKNKNPFFAGKFDEELVSQYGPYMNPEGQMVDLNKIYGRIGQNTSRIGPQNAQVRGSRFTGGNYYANAGAGTGGNVGADLDGDGFFDNNPQLESYFQGYSRLMEGYAGAEQMIGQAEFAIQGLNEKYTDIINKNAGILAMSASNAMMGTSPMYSKEEIENAKNALVQAEQDYKSEISGITTKFGTEAYNFKKNFYSEAFPFINAAFEGDNMNTFTGGGEDFYYRTPYAPDLLDQITRFDIHGTARDQFKPKVPLLYGDDELYTNLYDARGLSNTHMRQEIEDAANENRPIDEENFLYNPETGGIKTTGQTNVYNIEAYAPGKGGGYTSPASAVGIKKKPFADMNLFTDPNFLDKYGVNNDEDHDYAAPTEPRWNISGGGQGSGVPMEIERPEYDSRRVNPNFRRN